MTRYPSEKALSIKRSVTETTSVSPFSTASLEKALTRSARFRVVSDINVPVREHFVFML